RVGSLRAASMARSVAGRPAAIGVETPGSRTLDLIGTTGRVRICEAMYSPLAARAASCGAAFGTAVSQPKIRAGDARGSALRLRALSDRSSATSPVRDAGFHHR